MVKFNIESVEALNSDIGNIINREDRENVIKVPIVALVTPEINADNLHIIEFIAKYKGLGSISDRKVIKSIIKRYNRGQIKDNADLITCLVAIERIRKDALIKCEETDGNYRVTFDMSELDVDTLELGRDFLEEEEVDKLRLRDVLEFISNYCSSPFVNMEITICLSDFDFEFMDREAITNIVFENGDIVTFTECLDFEDDCEDSINVTELLEEQKKSGKKGKKKK